MAGRELELAAPVCGRSVGVAAVDGDPRGGAVRDPGERRGVRALGDGDGRLRPLAGGVVLALLGVQCAPPRQAEHPIRGVVVGEQVDGVEQRRGVGLAEHVARASGHDAEPAALGLADAGGEQRLSVGERLVRATGEQCRSPIGKHDLGCLLAPVGVGEPSDELAAERRIDVVRRQPSMIDLAGGIRVRGLGHEQPCHGVESVVVCGTAHRADGLQHRETPAGVGLDGGDEPCANDRLDRDGSAVLVQPERRGDRRDDVEAVGAVAG